MNCPQIFTAICCLTLTAGFRTHIQQDTYQKERWYDRDISVEKRGPMSYVVERGCPYLTHYVRKNYFSFFDNRPASTDGMTTTSTIINWVEFVYQACVELYVPVELFHGLVNCGKSYALYAVNPPENVINALKANFTLIPGVGK